MTVVRVGQGALPTGIGGTVDVTWADAGIPDACMFFSVGAETLDTDFVQTEGGIGFSDFTDEICFNHGGRDNVGTPDATHAVTDDACAVMRSDTAEYLATCQASTVTDGVRLTRDQAGLAHLFIVVAFFGGEWAVLREINNSDTETTAVDIAHTLSGEPNLGFFSMNAMNAYGTGQSGMERCFGMFTNVSDTIVQRCVAMFGTSNPFDIGARVMTNRVAAVMDGIGDIDVAIEITDVDDTNIEFTVRDNDMGADSWGGLVGLIDEEVELLTIDSPNDEDADWNNNAVSFMPQAVIGSMGTITSVDSSKANDEGNTFGQFAVDDLGNEYSAAFYSEDGAGSSGSPALTDERDSLNSNMVVMTATDDVALYEWQNLTFTADGFDVTDANNIANSATTHKWPMLFIGEETAGSTNIATHLKQGLTI